VVGVPARIKEAPPMRTTPPAPDDPEATSSPAAATAAPAGPTRRAGALPDGHVLPFPYELYQGAVFHVADKKDRTGEVIGEIRTRVTYGPLCVARMCSSAEGEQWFDLEWRDSARIVTRRVDGAVLRSGRTLVRELGIAGIPVIEADAKHVERYLAAYRTANSDILEETRMTIARHLGWQEDGATFVTGDGAPWPVEPGQPEQRPALSAHHPCGTLEQWRQAVAHLERYPVVRIALAAGFAPALLRILGERSFTLDISGRSTRGKSTAAAVALSAWADPSGHGEGMATWKATQLMIEKRLNLVRGLPVVLDETRVVKTPEVVDQVLYQVSMNHGAARGGGWASMLPWHTIVISTGEQPALSFTSHEGAAARVLSLRRPPFGTDGQRSATDARAVTDAIAEHYGTAGPEFVHRLCALLAEDDGAGRLRKRHGELVDEHAGHAHSDIARRRAPLVAALHLAAQLAHEWEIVPLPSLQAAVFAEHFAEESAREDRGEMALDVVRALIAAHSHRICPLNAAAAELDPPSAGWIGAHSDKDGVPAIGILPRVLAEELGRATPPIAIDAVKEAWTERGSILLEGKRLARITIGGNQSRAYVFPVHILDGEDVPDGPDTPDADPAKPEAESAPAFEQGELGAGGWPKGTIGDMANREP
jgi:hypothetical protein